MEVTKSIEKCKYEKYENRNGRYPKNRNRARTHAVAENYYIYIYVYMYI